MIKNVFSLMIKDWQLVTAILLTTVFLVTGAVLKEIISGDNVPEPLQTVLISITTTIFIFVISRECLIILLHKRYSKIEGNYTSYSYKSDKAKDVHKDIYYELNDTKNDSAARLKYIGGNSFVITVDDGTHKWRGDFVMASSNKANISWWYLKPDKMRYSFGYKTAVIRIECKNVHIVLFGEDRSRFGRELLVKEVE